MHCHTYSNIVGKIESSVYACYVIFIQLPRALTQLGELKEVNLKHLYMQTLSKVGSYVNLRSWNARRFPGQILVLKRIMVLKAVVGHQEIMHMSVKSIC